MAKKSTPRIGQQTKTSAKGAHGGGVKFSQISLGPGFKKITKGIANSKSAAKLPQPKANISEGSTMGRPNVAFGKGFGTNPFIVHEAKKGTQTSTIGGKRIKEKAGKLTKDLGKPPSEASAAELKRYVEAGKTPAERKKRQARVNLARAHVKGAKARHPGSKVKGIPAVKPGKGAIKGKK